MNRRSFLRRAAAFGGLAALGPLHALGQRVAMGAPLSPVLGYGPLVDKGDLWLPKDFNYQIISRQGQIMSDGSLTPGIFDGMGAFSGGRSAEVRRQTILIRNHENRELPEEIRVTTGPGFEYDGLAFGGSKKLGKRHPRAQRRRAAVRTPC